MYGSGKVRKPNFGVQHIDYDLHTRYLGSGIRVYIKSEKDSFESRMLSAQEDLERICQRKAKEGIMQFLKDREAERLNEKEPLK